MRACLLLVAVWCAVADITAEECEKKLSWYDDITDQAVKASKELKVLDPLFRESMSSISEAEAECGDVATGEPQESCADFKNWATLTQLAENKGRKFKVFDGEPRFSDIGQGTLGDCYFLSALASVASARPEYINRMFVKRELYSEGVYTTRWRLNGDDIEVVVNGKVPTTKSGKAPAFAKPQVRGEAQVNWAVIAEKAWGKIFGNYQAVAGGLWVNAIASITAAVSRTMSHKKNDADTVWEFLQQGTTQKWPMGASTGGENCSAMTYNLACQHAYAVLKAFMYNGQRAVECFNPWNKDKYHGSIPNEDKSDGSFKITLEEYLDAFGSTQMAELHEDYKTTSQRTAGDHGVMRGIYEFTVPDDEAFDVGAHWPSSHLLNPCKVPDPNIAVAVAKKGHWEEVFFGTAGGAGGINVASTEVTAGPGTYLLFVDAVFQDADAWIPNIHATVYAPSRVEFTRSEMAREEAAKLLFLPACDDDAFTVKVESPAYNGLYKKSNHTVTGITYYVSSDGKYHMFFSGASGKWEFVKSSKWSTVAAGKFKRMDDTHGYSRKELGVCGMKDSVKIGDTDVTCEDVKLMKKDKYSCGGAKLSDLVLRFCPETCEEERRQKESVEKDPSLVKPDCSEVSVLGLGKTNDGLYKESEREKVENIPVYISLDQKRVLYYKAKCKGWAVNAKSKVKKLQGGAVLKGDCVPKDELKCGRFDATTVGLTGKDCSSSSKRCAKSTTVQRYCPHSCTDSIELWEASVAVPSFDTPRADLGLTRSVGALLLCAFSVAAVGFVKKRVGRLPEESQAPMLQVSDNEGASYTP